MNRQPFSAPGRFWRGNLHTHSTRSDGHRTPEQVCAFYRESGYDFLALTDHFLKQYEFPITDITPYRTPEFTTILGAELHSGKTEAGQLWHILAVGLPADFAPTPPEQSGPELAARALEAGAFVAAAHPAWYGLTETDIRSLGEINAVEIFNGTAVDHNDKPDSWHILDVLLARGLTYSACATDDAHFNPDRHDTLRGWVQVKSDVLHPDALLEALKAGAYYSSTGPQIHDIQLIPGERLSVRCSPVNRIFVTGAASVASSVHGHGLTDVEFNLKSLSSSPYLRVTVRDEHGGRAWSNPIYL